MPMNDLQMGQQAKRLMKDEVFLAAVASLDGRIVQRWRKAATSREREKAHADQRLLRALIQELETIIGNGEYEEEMERIRAERDGAT